MKSIKYIAITLSTAALALTSCSDSFLDHQPDERTQIDNEDKVVQLLRSSYPDCNPSWMGEINSDNIIDNQTPHMPSNPNTTQVLSHYNYSQYSLWDNQLFRFEPATQATYSDYDSPGFLWGSYYSSIAQTNAALDAINEISAKSGMTEKLKAARGEAELIRAYDHFMLVNFFSPAFVDSTKSKNDVGVPYVTEVEHVVNKQYDRSNVADTYKKIQADLEAGLADISDLNFNTAPKYHFNVDAAHAFAARFYLFSHQWEKVIEHADAVLGTDSASIKAKTMNYGIFGDCSTSDDYATQWQNPSLGNNLMLLTTNTVLSRRIFGYRYSIAGEGARGALMIHNNNPLWRGYICPTQLVVSGQLFANSSHDYGFYNCKIGEKFEYTDRIAGIGYPHVVYRAFTGNELLLERAEAKIMLGRYREAADDLEAYWNLGLSTYTASDRTAYIATGYARQMTDAVFTSYYNNPDNDNCYANWDFAKAEGLDIPQAAVPYMNCLNEFRRMENAFEGMRFFDIKRWGLTVAHSVGVDSEDFTLKARDSRLNVEIPWESMSAGMESSRTTTTPATVDASQNVSDYVVKSNK